ncbi:hypothetical protein, partial [Vibrio azureus]|uniref:hypothetical protein n=1 Tax=Vibrio azureus TaxID=512649 RepID=UPI0013767A8A
VMKKIKFKNLLLPAILLSLSSIGMQTQANTSSTASFQWSGQVPSGSDIGSALSVATISKGKLKIDKGDKIGHFKLSATDFIFDLKDGSGDRLNGDYNVKLKDPALEVGGTPSNDYLTGATWKVNNQTIDKNTDKNITFGDFNNLSFENDEQFPAKALDMVNLS